jgi:hypothetical protein
MLAPGRIKTATPASKRPQTHTFDRVTTEIGNL